MEISNLTTEILVFLFFVGVIAGFLDTLVGGGGLIAVPALLLSGIPPIYVLGTNKLQGSMGTGIATFLLFRKKKLEWQMVKKLMIASFIGSVLGGIIVQFVDTEVLSFVIPIVLVFIAIYFIVSPKPKAISSSSKSDKRFESYAVPGVGFYDGMFGPDCSLRSCPTGDDPFTGTVYDPSDPVPLINFKIFGCCRTCTIAE